MGKNYTIFILAGEPSGDIHGANLMQDLKNLIPNINFIGIGGKNMQNEGLNSTVDIQEISVVGFSAVAKKYFFFKRLQKTCKHLLISQKIDLFLPIDYPGFNISLAKFAKSKNIPVYYYIAPQLWAWWSSRAKKLKGAVDKLLVILPFESDFFKTYGISAEYVGNPLLDEKIFQQPIKKFSERENIIAFFPGSREEEVRRNLIALTPLLLSIEKYLKQFQIVIAVSKNINKQVYLKHFTSINFKNYLFTDNSRELMQKAKFGIIKTGTTTLEAGLLGLPFIMFYKASKTNYLIGKNLLNLSSVSLVNIILDKVVKQKKVFFENELSFNKQHLITEYVQTLDLQKIIEEINLIAIDENNFNIFQKELFVVNKVLVRNSETKKPAEIIQTFLLDNN